MSNTIRLPELATAEVGSACWVGEGGWFEGAAVNNILCDDSTCLYTVSIMLNCDTFHTNEQHNRTTWAGNNWGWECMSSGRRWVVWRSYNQQQDICISSCSTMIRNTIKAIEEVLSLLTQSTWAGNNSSWGCWWSRRGVVWRSCNQQQGSCSTVIHSTPMSNAGGF